MKEEGPPDTPYDMDGPRHTLAAGAGHFPGAHRWRQAQGRFGGSGDALKVTCSQDGSNPHINKSYCVVHVQ